MANARLPIAGLGVMALIAAFGSAQAQADAVPSPGIEWVTEPACERPLSRDPVALKAYTATFPEVGPEDTPAWLDWLANDAAQAAVDRINDVSARHVNSIFGSYSDHFLQAIVVTIEPTVTNPDHLLTELEQAAGADLRVIARPACRSRVELERAREALLGRNWHPRAGSLNWGAYIDASNSRLVVDLPVEATDEAATLRARFGDVVELRANAPEHHDRWNDGSPHYGGAAIGALNNSFCTAGFAMDLNGGRWMVTAAHCSLDYQSTSWYSGSKYYGLELAQHNKFPNYDVMLIGSGIETYARIIHTTQPAGHTRLVTAKANPKLHDIICISGKVSEAHCAIEVVDNAWSGCMDDMCYQGEAMGYRADLATIAQLGDSGAPIYQQLPNNNARILGMHVGSPYQLRYYTVFLKVSKIEYWTNAQVAITCCTDTSW